MGISDLAIVVVNYNNYNQTLKTIDNISQYNITTIIVDNNSTNDSYKIIEDRIKGLSSFYLIKTDKNGGYSYGNNFGIHYIESHFHSKYVCIMNPDIIVDDINVFKKLVSDLESDSNLLAITSKTIYNGQNLVPNPCAFKLLNSFKLVFSDTPLTRKLINRYYKSLDKEITYVDKVQGCFFIVNMALFKKLNYFDDNIFLYFEEDIIGYKARRLGYKIAVDTTTYINHNHEEKDSEMLNVKKRRFYNKAFLHSKRYYMCKIKKFSKVAWFFSFLLDYPPRKLKDIYLSIKQR